MDKLKRNTFYLHKWDLIREKRSELQGQINEINKRRKFVKLWEMGRKKHFVLKAVWNTFDKRKKEKERALLECISANKIAIRW